MKSIFKNQLDNRYWLYENPEGASELARRNRKEDIDNC